MLFLHIYFITSKFNSLPIIHKANIFAKIFLYFKKVLPKEKIKSMIKMRILRSNSGEQSSKSLLQFCKVHSTKSICNDPENQSSSLHDNKRNRGWKQIKVGS